MATFNATSTGALDKPLEMKYNTLVTLLNQWASTVWTSNNDGSGSGLDSDLLDARHASAFAWSESQTTADVNTIIQSGMYRMNLNTNRPTGTNYGQLLVVHGAGDTIFQMATDYASGKMYWRSGNPSDVGGSGSWGAWRLIWHDGNDGAGSGLDADTVDGSHASAFLGASATAVDSDKLDGYHRSTINGTTGGPDWSSIPYIKSNGYMEIGIGIDFHVTESDSGNYMFEIYANQGMSQDDLYITHSSGWNWALSPDGSNLNMGTVVGTRIGTATTQKIGFYNATPIVRPSAYTQTYSTASKTAAALTGATLTDGSGGTANTTLESVGTTYNQSVIRNNFADLAAMVNKHTADITTVYKVVTQIIDDLQALGLVG